MFGRLFTVASLLSLVLCGAVIVPWVRSASTNDCLSWVNEAGTLNWWIECSRGVFFACLDRYRSRELNDPGWRFEAGRDVRNFSIFFALADRTWRFGSFGIASDRSQTHSRRICTVPCWAVTVALGIAPISRLLLHLRTHARRRGRCRSCGYDLRATPDRCPECGAVSERSQS